MKYSPWCGDDQAMCCICFGCFDIKELWRDENGDAWDVCVSCQTIEDQRTPPERKQQDDDHEPPGTNGAA